MKRSSALVATLLTVAFAMSSPAIRAEAATVTYDFTGKLTSAGGFGLWAAINTGDSFSGSVSFDDTVPNQVTGNPTTSRFLSGNLVLTIEGITFQLGNSFDEREILVTHSGTGEQWFLKNIDSAAGGSTATANGSVIDTLIQSLTINATQDSDIYPSIGFPLTTTATIFFQNADLTAGGTSFLAAANGIGYIDSFNLRTTAVPLPATLPLLLCSLAGMALLARSRTKGRTGQ